MQVKHIIRTSRLRYKGTKRTIPYKDTQALLDVQGLEGYRVQKIETFKAEMVNSKLNIVAGTLLHFRNPG